MRHVASQFQLACLQLRYRVEELFEFLKYAFGAVRTTHRAAHALPIHLLCCFLAYSLYKSLVEWTVARPPLFGLCALMNFAEQDR